MSRRRARRTSTELSRRIIASGYHTLSLTVRLLVDEIRSEGAVISGLGIDDVRWHTPVRPGDTVTASNEVVGTRVSESDRDTGIVHDAITVTNQNGEAVLTLDNYELVASRSDAE